MVRISTPMAFAMRGSCKWCKHNMAMNQYLLIPFLEGWTSIYQLLLCSPGVQGFDPLPYVNSEGTHEPWNLWEILGDGFRQECGPNGKNSAGCYARFPGCFLAMGGAGHSGPCDVWHGVISNQLPRFMIFVKKSNCCNRNLYNLYLIQFDNQHWMGDIILKYIYIYT